ncbi:MAG: F0F1 ATP synthase subunit B [Brumimicrobium sp.]
MEKLINEFSIGMFFWQTLLFLVLLFLLRKFAWKPILKAVNSREENIQDALDMAVKTKAEMKKLQTQNENFVKEARVERDQMIKEAKETGTRLVEDSKKKAKEEADKIIENARASITSEKNAAISELKGQVASVALEIAEKVLREELSSSDKQKMLASKLAEDISLN